MDVDAQDHKSTNDDSGEKEEEDDHFRVQCDINIKPNIGEDEQKIGLAVHVSFLFDQFYPYQPPKITLTTKKGLDDFLFSEIEEQFKIQ